MDECRIAAFDPRDETTWFWSRSRQELWNKGATSGNMQRVISIDADCDADTLLVKVDSPGPACHTGARSCFFNRIYDAPEARQRRNSHGSSYCKRTTGQHRRDHRGLASTIHARRDASPDESYTARLLTDVEDELLKKIAEEASEVIMACKDNDHDHIRYEAGDLVYHLLVTLERYGVSIDELAGELNARTK